MVLPWENRYERHSMKVPPGWEPPLPEPDARIELEMRLERVLQDTYGRLSIVQYHVYRDLKRVEAHTNLWTGIHFKEAAREVGNIRRRLEYAEHRRTA
jgi:hypothetical protein